MGHLGQRDLRTGDQQEWLTEKTTDGSLQASAAILVAGRSSRPAGLVIALLIIDTPRIHAATDPDRCVVQRYLAETHLAKPEVQAELDGLTPSQRQKVLVEMTRMIHQHSLDRVYLVERQRVRRGAPDVCGVGREGDPR